VVFRPNTKPSAIEKTIWNAFRLKEDSRIVLCDNNGLVQTIDSSLPSGEYSLYVPDISSDSRKEINVRYHETQSTILIDTESTPNEIKEMICSAHGLKSGTQIDLEDKDGRICPISPSLPTGNYELRVPEVASETSLSFPLGVAIGVAITLVCLFGAGKFSK